MSQIIDQKILFSNDSTADFCGELTFPDVRNSFPFKMCTDGLTNWDFMLKCSLPEGNVTSTDQESARGGAGGGGNGRGWNQGRLVMRDLAFFCSPFSIHNLSHGAYMIQMETSTVLPNPGHVKQAPLWFGALSFCSTGPPGTICPLFINLCQLSLQGSTIGQGQKTPPGTCLCGFWRLFFYSLILPVSQIQQFPEQKVCNFLCRYRCFTLTIHEAFNFGLFWNWTPNPLSKNLHDLPAWSSVPWPLPLQHHKNRRHCWLAFLGFPLQVFMTVPWPQRHWVIPLHHTPNTQPVTDTQLSNLFSVRGDKAVVPSLD